jgi:catalase
MVAARGSMAHGYYENYEPVTDFRRADIFSKAGLRTPAFSGSPTVAGTGAPGPGAGCARVRGQAVHQAGQLDLVG